MFWFLNSELVQAKSPHRTTWYDVFDYRVLNQQTYIFMNINRLFGLVVKVSASRAADPGINFRVHRGFSGSNYIGDLKIGTPVATLPGTWRYRVSVENDWPGVRIL